MKKVRDKDLFFGTSLTLTRSNFDTLTDPDFTGDLFDTGCRFFLYLEYNPIREGTEDWVITDEQRSRVMDVMRDFRSRWSALFIAVPGDEEEIGGCLSAGRGFVHVSAEGDLEPCPFAPYSDANLHDVSLKEALQSDFLKKIRENRDRRSNGMSYSL